nr:ABC transporter ATP-binding protein [Quadrisphaera sp. DSM 44207]
MHTPSSLDRGGVRALLARGRSRAVVHVPPEAAVPAQRPGAAGAPAVELRDVTRTYPGGVRALDGVSVTVRPGTFTAVVGPSGSGKSTLMHCAAGLDVPTTGTARIDGVDVGALDETRRTELRRTRTGFVFQAYNLMPALSVADNITLPLRLAGVPADPAWLSTLVERLGLGEWMGHRPAELSGGQQQRAAIARALVARPAVVFADEPTGALDLRTAHEVLDLLRGAVDDLGQTVVVVTHDPSTAARADRALVMADGRVVDVLEAPTAAGVSARLLALGGE